MRQSELDLLALAQAMDRGFVTVSSVRSKAGILWRRRCVAERWPFIEVRSFRTRATLWVDLEPAGVRFLDGVDDAIGGVFLALASVMRCWCSHHPERLYIARIPIPVAEALARQFWTIATDPRLTVDSPTLHTRTTPGGTH